MKKYLICLLTILLALLIWGCNSEIPEEIPEYYLTDSPINVVMNKPFYLTNTLAKETKGWGWNGNILTSLGRINAHTEEFVGKAVGSTWVTAVDDINWNTGNRQQCLINVYQYVVPPTTTTTSTTSTTSTTTTTTTTTIPQSQNDTATYGTYDSWGYFTGMGWLKVPNNQLNVSETSLVLGASTLFPSQIPTVTDQVLHIKDGQIWMTCKMSGQDTTLYLLDYYLENNQRYGTSILWIKADNTNSATLTTLPNPATASISQILTFIPVGNTPQ